MPKVYYILSRQAIQLPEMLYRDVVEVECRVVPHREDDLLFQGDMSSDSTGKRQIFPFGLAFQQDRLKKGFFVNDYRFSPVTSRDSIQVVGSRINANGNPFYLSRDGGFRRLFSA